MPSTYMCGRIFLLGSIEGDRINKAAPWRRRVSPSDPATYNDSSIYRTRKAAAASPVAARDEGSVAWVAVKIVRTIDNFKIEQRHNAGSTPPFLRPRCHC